MASFQGKAGNSKRVTTLVSKKDSYLKCNEIHRVLFVFFLYAYFKIQI